MKTLNSFEAQLAELYSIDHNRWGDIRKVVKENAVKTGLCLHHEKCFAENCACFKNALHTLLEK